MAKSVESWLQIHFQFITTTHMIATKTAYGTGLHRDEYLLAFFGRAWCATIA